MEPVIDLDRTLCPAVRGVLALAAGALFIAGLPFTGQFICAFLFIHLCGHSAVIVSRQSGLPLSIRFARLSGWLTAVLVGTVLSRIGDGWIRRLSAYSLADASACDQCLVSQTIFLARSMVPEPIVWIFVAGSAVFFFALQPFLRCRIWPLLPNRWYETVAAFVEIVWNSGRKGGAILTLRALIHFVLWSIGLSALGFHGAGILAYVIAVFSSLPIVGQLIGAFFLICSVWSQTLKWSVLIGVVVIGAVIWFSCFLLFDGSIRRLCLFRIHLLSLPLLVAGYACQGMAGMLFLTLVFTFSYRALLPVCHSMGSLADVETP
ncbi:hypothetical protein JW992_05510 [candidate division KSB1 bacterium]|nr:hypothetical protein [candidate division KSB1 bacterium]